MSRIGKEPIIIPAGVNVVVQYPRVSVKGPKGNLEMEVRNEIDVELQDGKIVVNRKGESKMYRSLHGMTRTMIANLVTGVSKGFTKRLQVIGIGYRVMVEKNDLVLHLGYSNPVKFAIPEGISFEVDKLNNITVGGIDKHKVGQVAAEIRALRKVEPYKGKGIRYEGEFVRRKMGKTKTGK